MISRSVEHILLSWQFHGVMALLSVSKEQHGTAVALASSGDSGLPADVDAVLNIALREGLDELCRVAHSTAQARALWHERENPAPNTSCDHCGKTHRELDASGQRGFLYPYELGRECGYQLLCVDCAIKLSTVRDDCRRGRLAHGMNA